MPTVTIDVVIPVYGGWTKTKLCLERLAAQTVAHRVLLVDNDSPDETVSAVASEFPQVDVIEMGFNSGFARACNAGIKASAGEIVVLLNNDVYCEPTMLEELAKPFATDQRIGSAAPLLMRPNGSVEALGLVADATLASFLFGAGLNAAEVVNQQPLLIGPYGAAAAYRRCALESTQLLDEQLFMYGEELDLAIALAVGGWSCAPAPLAVGTHDRSDIGVTPGSQVRYLGGFGRGYLIRRYRLLTGQGVAVGCRVLMTELIAVAGDAARARDMVALKGRIKGFLAARKLPKKSVPPTGIDYTIGFVDSLVRRIKQ